MSEWSFEERLRRNPMPTKLISKEKGWRLVEARYDLKRGGEYEGEY